MWTLTDSRDVDIVRAGFSKGTENVLELKGDRTTNINFSSASETISWRKCLAQPERWYGSNEAVRVADQVLLYQGSNGGWPKNIDMARSLSDNEKKKLIQIKDEVETIIDNDATYTQMRYLAKVYRETKQDRFKESFLRGLDYLLKAQYDNGGWPMHYPPRYGAYWHYITFNDDAMVGVLRLLRDVAEKKEFFEFVDARRRRRAEKAVVKRIDCILKCQIVVDGKKTGWCAQHDDKTLEPRYGRPYERESISGDEGVSVVDFLMEIENPSPEIVVAVQAAVGWFDQVKLTGIRAVRKKQEPGADNSMSKLVYTRAEAIKELVSGYTEDLEKFVRSGNLREFRDESNRIMYKAEYDRVVIEDPVALPLWARFYEISTNRPLFCNRNEIVCYNLSEVRYELRNHYSFYTQRPRDLLAKRYPAWQKKWTPKNNVLRGR